MKIVTVLGARPQFVKAAVVSREICKTNSIIEKIVHTGQHYDRNMSALFFEELSIPQPAYHLGIGSGTHGQQTGRMLEEIERVLMQESPDCVLLYGDTNSTVAGALAAAKMNIPIAHVEAGPRLKNTRNPEEINRMMADHLSDLLFTPSARATQNLQNEGISEDKLFFVGDVMYDATLYYAALSEQKSTVMDQLSLNGQDFVLTTVHRQENTDDVDRFKLIVRALSDLGQNIPVVWPVHPRSKKALCSLGLWEKLEKAITLIEPIGFWDMLKLEKEAKLVVTDSGGVQKEAYYLGTPAMVLWHETAWPELVEKGWNTLVNSEDLPNLIEKIGYELSRSKTKIESPYGDGSAGKQIVSVLDEIMEIDTHVKKHPTVTPIA